MKTFIMIGYSKRLKTTFSVIILGYWEINDKFFWVVDESFVSMSKTFAVFVIIDNNEKFPHYLKIVC